jgi:hypothetical protein
MVQHAPSVPQDGLRAVNRRTNSGVLGEFFKRRRETLKNCGSPAGSGRVKYNAARRAKIAC